MPVTPLQTDNEVTPFKSRRDKTGVPVFRHEHRRIFNKMVRDSGFRSVQKLADATGFNIQNFCSLFANHISSHLYHPLRSAVLEATGIDLDALAISANQPADIAPGPLEDMHDAGLITDAELAAGHRLAAAANGRDYSGRDPLSSLVRTWPKDLQAMWQALQSADAETDRCRPRLPTASLVSWNVSVLHEPIDLREPTGRDALTSLRIALQTLEGF